MPVAAGVCIPREQQDIALPLVIPFGMVMFDIFAQRSPQRALAKEDHLTTRLGRTYRCTRTRRSHVPSRLSVACWPCQFWADCTIHILERKFPTGTGREIARFLARTGGRPQRRRPAHQLFYPNLARRD